uniref:RING-type domain-containing protein n=1 Tax=Paramormyrops kingsleyae TaxID=1676925 RepID=A0A3B3R6D3_9TELE
MRLLSSMTVPPEGIPDLECAICYSQFNNVFRTPKKLQCKHTFCLECLARMNVKSSQPDTIQCPFCRALTPLPTLGLPKLDNDTSIMSNLPEAMQHVYRPLGTGAKASHQRTAFMEGNHEQVKGTAIHKHRGCMTHTTSCPPTPVCAVRVDSVGWGHWLCPPHVCS